MSRTLVIETETTRAADEGTDILEAGRPHGGDDDRDDVADAQPQRAEPPDWRVLYRRLGERVFRLIHRMVHDADLAHDLTHDTFVRVFETSGQYAGRGTVDGWVFSIAVNLVRERGRTVGRRVELLDRESASFARSTRDDSARVESRLLLERALAALPDEQRTALLLYEVDGYSHAEIGAMLGIAEGSSKARVSRAKAALRVALEGRI